MSTHFATPEEALLAYGAACAAGDVEAAVSARNFAYEARAMLRDLQGVPRPSDDQLEHTTRMLETAFRNQFASDDLSASARVQRRIVESTSLGDDLVELMEECIFPDQSTTRESSHAVRSSAGWQVVELFDI